MNELTQNRGQGLLMVVRITVEAASAFFITAAIVNYGVRCSQAGSWFMTLQIVPAALSLFLTTLAFWVAVTLMFGRIYCSTVCPMGALIDLFARMRPRRRVYRFSRPLNAVRAIAAALILGVFACAPALSARWLDPYGLYAGLARSLAAPEVSAATFAAAAVVGAIAYTAYRRGRLLCNSLCPVGTLLGALARRSAFHIDIDTDRCTQCRRCADACKAQCIDLNDHVADMSRCVVCFDCLPVCGDDAIAYTLGRHRLSTPLMQKIGNLKSENQSTSLAASCNNISTSCKTSSTTEPSKPTAPEPER